MGLGYFSVTVSNINVSPIFSEEKISLRIELCINLPIFDKNIGPLCINKLISITMIKLIGINSNLGVNSPNLNMDLHYIAW